MHKLSPHWRGPHKVVKIPDSFQVVYDDQGREKIPHVDLSNCKKFHKRLVGGEMKWVNQMNCQNAPSSRRKMTLCRFEVCVGGMLPIVQ